MVLQAAVPVVVNLPAASLTALREPGMVAMSEDGFVSPYQIAIVYARLEDEPKAPALTPP